MSRLLGDIAHIRTGDKGPLTTISVTCDSPDDYALLAERLSSELVARRLGDRIVGIEGRYELPKTESVLFVCVRAPADTVNTSLHLDRHGKTIGSALYGLEL